MNHTGTPAVRLDHVALFPGDLPAVGERWQRGHSETPRNLAASWRSHRGGGHGRGHAGSNASAS